MPTNIEIQPDVANKLFSAAEMRGVSINTLLRQILKRLDKPDESSNDWRLSGSIELLDENLESGSLQIARSLQKSLLEIANRV